MEVNAALIRYRFAPETPVEVRSRRPCAGEVLTHGTSADDEGRRILSLHREVWSCFDQGNGAASLLAEPGRDHCSGRACADNDGIDAVFAPRNAHAWISGYAGESDRSRIATTRRAVARSLAGRTGSGDVSRRSDRFQCFTARRLLCRRIRSTPGLNQGKSHLCAPGS